MILVDTSAWIEYDRATGSVVHARLAELIDSSAIVAITEPVTMELLSGLRRRTDEQRAQGLIARATLLAFDSAADFEGASYIYRLCRAAGVTPRSLIDCMIANVAIRFGASILANDLDFARIASVVALELDPATPTEG